MYIGKAAQLSGTTIKSIRHYEAIGLLPSPQRQGKYRIYSQHSVEWLKFIKCAQQLGFKLKEMLTIVENHPGQPLPWEVVSNAIEVKKMLWRGRSKHCNRCRRSWLNLKPVSRMPHNL